jgi:hypothetical protein
VVLAEAPPGEVEVDDVVLVEALAPPPVAGVVEVGLWGFAVCELVVVCVFDPVVVDVGDGVGLGVGADEEVVFQFVVKVVVVLPASCDP